MTVLRFLWLGSPALEVDGRPLQLEMRKTLALLAYLSMVSQSPTRETLAALFWPDYDQQHALANLRRHLSSLTKSLPAGLLETDREKIGLHRGETLTIDVEEFREQLAYAEKLFHTAGKLEDYAAALKKGISLYKGDFFEGFNLRDCPEFDNWQYFERENLRSEYAKALEKLVRVYQQTGAWEEAIDYARSWLMLDQLHEPAHRILMRLYYQSGAKISALRQYDECRRIMEQELNQPPEPETLELYEEILKEVPPKAVPGSNGVLAVKTKFFLPKPPRTMLHRPRLVSLLNHSANMPLILLSASAGFGKTTLLAEWAAQSQDNIAWISLDRDDNEVYRLVECIITAIRDALQETNVGSMGLSLLRSSQPVQFSLIISSLINDLLSIPKRLVLVLDDYHNIESLTAHDAINYLLDHRPENLHLIVSTRSDPPLSLARLRANVQLCDIRTDNLRFTPDETQSFLTQAIGFPLSEQDIVFIDGRIEGWIAGIQMAALVMQSGHLAQSSQELQSFIRAFKGSQRHILDYLLEEVLNRQPEEVRLFLMRTSILEKMCYQLCDFVLNDVSTDEEQAVQKSSQHILEYLERSNLFVIPLDDERRWYRYHHLFADLLHIRLQQHEPRLETELHRRAASWFAQNAHSIEAVRHALESGDYSYSADLIAEYSLKLIWMNQIVTTLDWFKSLPPDVVESHPLLTIYLAFILARKGESTRAETMMANAEVSIAAMPHSAKIDEYKILVLGMQAFLANLKGNPAGAIQFGSRISPDTRIQFPASYHMARAQLAVAQLDLGNYTQAEKIFGEIGRWAQDSQDIPYAVLTIKELADIQLIKGRPTRAEKIYQEMDRWIQQVSTEPSLYNGLIKIYQASLLIEKNDLEAARMLLQEDIESTLSIWRSSSIYVGYIVAATLQTALGNFESANHSVSKAFQYVTSQSFYPRNKSMVHACQVNLWLAEGNLAEAQKWALLNFPQMPTELPVIRELDHICLARILIANRQWIDALGLLQGLSAEAELGQRYGRLLKIDILRALVLDRLSRRREALEVLGKCLGLAYPETYMRVFLDEGTSMRMLIEHGRKVGGWPDPAIQKYAEKIYQAFSAGVGAAV